jgi:hypothetical protein
MGRLMNGIVFAAKYPLYSKFVSWMCTYAESNEWEPGAHWRRGARSACGQTVPSYG